MARVGRRGRWEVAGSAVHPYQLDYHRAIAGMVAGAAGGSTTGARLHLNPAPGEIDGVLGRARVYCAGHKDLTPFIDLS